MHLRYLLSLSVLLSTVALTAQAVTPWLTRGDQSVLLAKQPPVQFATTAGSSSSVITVDATNTFQSLDAYGFTLTQGSAQVISGLAPGQQKKLLRELFGNDGLAMSAIRISIGASDLSNSSYTYNETDGNTDMSAFSLTGPDATYLLPIIKQILEIRPDLKILATPWTAPTWMKTNDSFVGGRLLPAYYQAYARYFVTYLRAMRAQGIEIWAITPQNEPENPHNNPSMEMSAAEQLLFVDEYLGPQIEDAGYSPLIIGYDHNCDNTSFPITVANGSDYVDGSAFHLYAGSISAMTTVRSATGKGVYFTEQYTGSNGSFDGDFGWHMENVVIGSINNWSKSVFEWNLAADPDLGPYTEGGCTECLPAVTVRARSKVDRNVSYYIIGQLAKFVRPGAVRLGVSSSDRDVLVTALQNPDATRLALAYNRSGAERTVSVRDQGRSFDYTIPGRSAVTFTWSTNGTATSDQAPYSGAPIALPGTLEVEDFDAGGLGIAYTDFSPGNSGGAYRDTDVDIEACSEGGYNIGYTDDGEWLEYTVTVATDGLYDIGFRVSTPNDNGAVSMSLGGLDLTGRVPVPSTGGYQDWQTVTAPAIPLAAGTQVVRLNILTGGFNFNRVEVTESAPVAGDQTPYGETPIALPGTIEVENFDAGGSGLAYNDLSPGNSGGQYRDTDVDIENCSEGGFNIGYTDDGEWLEFTVDVIAEGLYDIGFRVSTPNTTSAVSLSLEGVDLTGRVAVPNTGGYQNWETITARGIALTAGIQVVRLNILTGGFNMNRVDVRLAAPQVDDATYYNIISRISGKGLDIQDVSYADNGNVQQYEITGQGGLNQQWAFYEQGEGYYQIQVRHSGRCLSPMTDSDAPGENVVQQTCTEDTRQQWERISAGDGYFYFRNRQSGNYLDVADQSVENGANIQVWSGPGGENQQWRLISLSVPDGEGSTSSFSASEVAQLRVYPNPAFSTLNISLPQGNVYREVQLLNLKGQVIRARSLPADAGNYPLEVEALPAGTYVLRFLAPATGPYTTRFIKH